jgi:AcrR family transcriptional regulator
MEARDHYHHGALKKALVDIAFKALEEGGLESLSLRGLAERAGVSKTAPYRHFADKRELLATLAAEGFSRLAERLASSAEGRKGDSSEDSVAALVSICEAYIQFALENRALYRLMFSSLGYSLHSEACRQNSLRAMGYLIQAVVEAQARGWRSGLDQRALVLSLWAEVHGWAGLLIDKLIPPEVAEGEAEWRALLAAFLE